jgi:hypothetical protein
MESTSAKNGTYPHPTTGIYQPSGKRDIDRPRGRWKETTILEAETEDSPNPCSDDDDDDDDDEKGIFERQN